MMAGDRAASGKEGESRGVRFLAARGYRILERNYRTRYGEIDIIAEEKGAIVFIEVKLRRSRGFGAPQEAVGRTKQRHIVRSALQYLKERRITGKDIRFDVLAIGPDPAAVELFRSAFMAPAKYVY